ncbi:MAG TPA: hypothetical protein DCW74_16905 [Alteromonas australica]|uniref:Uncharacterized protein n=1 Tax=Alteromonas australica TaxID=589873 RepID=A0A350P7Y2_9ALTE|nr:hypothetical protein [Alteromonas australica]
MRGTEYVGYSEFHPGNLIAQLAEIAVFANALHSDWRTNSSDYFVSLYLELTKAHIWSEARSPLKALVGEKVFGAPRILSAFEYRQENLFLIGSNAYTIIADNSVRSSVFGEHEPKIISLEYSEEPVWELQFPV